MSRCWWRPSHAQFMARIVSSEIANTLSSRAMALDSLGLTYSGPHGPNHLIHAYPIDNADWRRCVETFHAAPKSLKRRMLPTLLDYRQRLEARR